MRSLLFTTFCALALLCVPASAQQVAQLSLDVPPPGSTTISAGERITIEVFVNNISAPTLLRAYQAQLEHQNEVFDEAGVPLDPGFILPLPGGTGRLTPPLVACASDAECIESIGDGSTCVADPDGNQFCQSVFIDRTRLDWVFFDQITFGGVVVAGLTIGETMLSGGVEVPTAKYCGTYVFEASLDALGDFQISFASEDPANPGVSVTFLVDQNNLLIPFSVIPAAGLTVTVVEQVGNDNCANSQPISDGVTPFSTISATTDGPALPAACDEGNGNGTSFEQDVWFDHVATCTGILTVSTCDDASFDTRLAVYGAETPACFCPIDNTTLLACNDDVLGCTAGTSEVFLPVTEGNCYTIRVGGVAAAEGTGNLTITCAPDLCTNAEPLNVPSSISGSTENALANDAIGPDCGLGLPVSPGVWYSVIGTGNLMTARLGLGTAFDSRLTVYSGTCAALTCVGEADNIGAGQESVSWCSDLGVEYLILVHGAVGAAGTFTLDISDQGCDDGNACTDDFCFDGACVNDPNFDVNTFCCTPSNRTLTELDDANPCTDDICNPNTGVVSHPPVPDGPEPACDDGNPCTLDECESGSCVNIDINTLPCTTDFDCPGDISSCVEGFCKCAVTLELIADPGSLPVEDCYAAGEFVTVRVELGPATAAIISSEPIVGAQFFLEYDAATLDFVSMSPGGTIDPSSPFMFELNESVDPFLGTIDYLVGTDFGTGTQSPATVAVITFQAVAECNAFARFRPGGPNGIPNRLATLGGGQLEPTLIDLGTVRINGSPPILALCPSSVTVSSDPGVFTAVVSWPAPTATDSCDVGSLPVVCDPPSGSVFSAGTTTVTCTATNSCGVSDSCPFNVTVEPPLLTADVQLSATVASSPFDRCITFDIWDCDAAEGAQQATVQATLTFTNGIASVVDLPMPGGAWGCITARDELHTLRSTAPDFTTLDFGMHYTAGFVGSRPSGGHWLLGGNLNDDDFIDILDFGVFFPFFLTVADPNTPCGTIGPHASINGDNVVDLLDLVFISGNSLQASEPGCCGVAALTATGPIMAISVNDLRRLGMDDLVAADINQDGILDVDDVIALIEGHLPPPPDDGSHRGTTEGKAGKPHRQRSPRR